MKKAIGIALLLMLAVMSLGLASAETIVIPANDAVNGSVTVNADGTAGTASVVVEGASTNEDPADGYAAADSSGNCSTDGDGDFNDDSDGDGEPDNQTCEDAVLGQIPA